MRPEHAELGMDMRVSTFLREREKAVIRLLPRQNPFSNIENLGFSKLRCPFTKPLQQPQGMIILTGPTGSGKPGFTQSANRGKEHVNVVTVEDPVSKFARHYKPRCMRQLA